MAFKLRILDGRLLVFSLPLMSYVICVSCIDLAISEHMSSRRNRLAVMCMSCVICISGLVLAISREFYLQFRGIELVLDSLN